MDTFAPLVAGRRHEDPRCGMTDRSWVVEDRSKVVVDRSRYGATPC